MSRRTHWDAIIVGGGIIGLSLALRLRKDGATVLVVERGEPGREASHAAAGMLAHCDPHTPLLLRPLAQRSARIYAEFLQELQDESGETIDVVRDGVILLDDEDPSLLCPDARPLTSADVEALEPGLRPTSARATLLAEAAVNPRALSTAALKAAKHLGVEIVSGTAVTGIEVMAQRVTGVKTERAHFESPAVVNCAGAWAGTFGPVSLPTHPVKGQMLAKAMPVTYDEHGTPDTHRILRHVVRTSAIYLVPRTDGRIVIGSTLEDAGYDKRVHAETIQAMHERATQLLPALAHARMLETWAGLRPGTPDGLPILGATAVAGYFAATGHYRDGILLAPVTAEVMAAVIQGRHPELDLSPFSPMRFAS